MGEVLAFSPRPPATDWSANERGLLLLLTQQLEESYGAVDGVFGQTDSGDPWYVVTDASQEVLIHIARIDGQFVVHEPAVDMLHSVGSLWGALRQVMAHGAQSDLGGVVVAFNPSNREAQSFLSLIVAVGLFLELQGLEFGGSRRADFDASPRSSEVTPEVVAARLIAALDLEAERVEAHGALLAEPRRFEPVQAPPALARDHAVAIVTPQAAESLLTFQLSPLEPTNAVEARSDVIRPPQPHVAAPTEGEIKAEGFAAAKNAVAGTAGSDVLRGTGGGDVVLAGAGDDYVDGHGAGPGQVDRLEGGDGNDQIVMGARVVASGGAGADTFLVSAQPPADKAEGLLGVVLDFSAARGDHLEVQGQGQMTVVSSAWVADVMAAQGEALGESNVAVTAEVTQAVAGARVGFDINGDGREDVFILLGGATPASFHVGMTIANDHAAAPLEKVSLVGQPSPDLGPVGEPVPRG